MPKRGKPSESNGTTTFIVNKNPKLDNNNDQPSQTLWTSAPKPSANISKKPFKMTAKQFRLENQQQTSEFPTQSGWTELQTPTSGWAELPMENQQPETPQTPQTMSQIWQTQVDPNAWRNTISNNPTSTGSFWDKSNAQVWASHRNKKNFRRGTAGKYGSEKWYWLQTRLNQPDCDSFFHYMLVDKKSSDSQNEQEKQEIYSNYDETEKDKTYIRHSKFMVLAINQYVWREKATISYPKKNAYRPPKDLQTFHHQYLDRMVEKAMRMFDCWPLEEFQPEKILNRMPSFAGLLMRWKREYHYFRISQVEVNELDFFKKWEEPESEEEEQKEEEEKEILYEERIQLGVKPSEAVTDKKEPEEEKQNNFAETNYEEAVEEQPEVQEAEPDIQKPNYEPENFNPEKTKAPPQTPPHDTKRRQHPGQ